MRKLVIGMMVAGLFLTGCQSVKKSEVGSPDLVGPEWAVLELGGAPVLDEGDPHLVFLEGGRLAGSTGCNRILGRFTLESGGRISFSPAGTTMMACAPERMEQEQRFLGLLPEINRYEFDDSGNLILRTSDRVALVAKAR